MYIYIWCVCVRTGWHGILLFDYLHRTPSVPNSEAKIPNNLSIDRVSFSRIDFDTILKQRRCSKTQEFLREQRLSNEWNFQWNPCPLWQVHLCALGPSKSFESCRSAVRREVPKKMLRLVQYYQSHQINLLNQHARLVKFCVMATTCNYFIVPSTDPGNSRHVQSAKKKSWPRCCIRLLKVCNRLYIMFI